MTYPTKIYQLKIHSELVIHLFNRVPVEKEWRAIKNQRGVYSPRIDIAIGPFAERQQYQNEYNNLFDEQRKFIESLYEYNRLNIDNYQNTSRVLSISPLSEIRNMNNNSRCFAVIEIENAVSRKHLLGGVVNASALGRIGIVIGWTFDKINALVRLREYWYFLKMRGKNTYNTTNVFILTPEQFDISIKNIKRPDTNYCV